MKMEKINSALKRYSAEQGTRLWFVSEVCKAEADPTDVLGRGWTEGSQLHGWPTTNICAPADELELANGSYVLYMECRRRGPNGSYAVGKFGVKIEVAGDEFDVSNNFSREKSVLTHGLWTTPQHLQGDHNILLFDYIAR